MSEFLQVRPLIRLKMDGAERGGRIGGRAPLPAENCGGGAAEGLGGEDVFLDAVAHHQHFIAVLNAQLAGIRAARVGVTGHEIDAAAREVIKSAGFGEFFGHSFGHSLGLDIHEMPSASPSAETKMPVGAVISAEPGIYLPGKFGVRIEDVLILNETGCENITHADKDLIIL